MLQNRCDDQQNPVEANKGQHEHANQEHGSFTSLTDIVLPDRRKRRDCNHLPM